MFTFFSVGLILMVSSVFTIGDVTTRVDETVRNGATTDNNDFLIIGLLVDNTRKYN
jgi:hypothetical protein